MDRVEGLMSPVSDRRFMDAVSDRRAGARARARQRWVCRYELELLLRLAGFPRCEFQGDFAGGPLERDDQQMIAWAWREPA